MRKIRCLLTVLILLFGMTGLFACGSGNDSNTEEKDNSNYSISHENADYYTVSGTVNASSGVKATINISSNYPAYEVTGCTYNGEECTLEETTEERKTFTFVMPSEDVNLKVIGRWKDLACSGTNDFLSFNSENVYTCQSAKNDESYDNSMWGTPLVLEFTTDAAWMSIAEITCFSTQEDILPNNAIAVNKKTSSSSNAIVGGSIVIDRSKANVGATQIVLHVKSGNNSSYDAIIVATITITE